MFSWPGQNLDIVFFIYGFAFVAMGISILAQPREEGEFALGKILWLLAAFGLIHGLNEWLDMWTLIKGRTSALDAIRWVLIVSSFYFLFEFGRRLLLISGHDHMFWWATRIAEKSRFWPPLVNMSLIFVLGLMSDDFWLTGSTTARYFLCLPGGVCICIGLYAYYQHELPRLKEIKVGAYFFWASISFLFYGLFGGLVVPRADFFPANIINTDAFMNHTGTPIQLFRAACAVMSAIAFTGLLRIFNWTMVHKLKKAYADLNQAQIRLVQSEKMAAVGRLSSGIAHEIKNPLAIIIMGLEYIKSSTTGQTAMNPEIDRVIKSALRADKIVKGLLSFARQSALEFEETDIKQLIDDSIALVERQMGLKNIQINRTYPISAPKVTIDGNQIKQVLINIMINAYDAMPVGGSLDIDLAESRFDDGRPCIKLIFTDTGCGISEENLHKTFEPFFTTKRDHGGVGLGLSVGHGIIEKHHGTINIKSKLGEGTSVIIRLPLPS